MPSVVASPRRWPRLPLAPTAATLLWLCVTMLCAAALSPTPRPRGAFCEDRPPWGRRLGAGPGLGCNPAYTDDNCYCPLNDGCNCECAVHTGACAGKACCLRDQVCCTAVDSCDGGTCCNAGETCVGPDVNASYTCVPPSVSPTPSVTPSDTPSISVTPSTSMSPTVTATVSQTQTCTPSGSMTPTVSLTRLPPDVPTRTLVLLVAGGVVGLIVLFIAALLVRRRCCRRRPGRRRADSDTPLLSLGDGPDLVAEAARLRALVATRDAEIAARDAVIAARERVLEEEQRRNAARVAAEAREHANAMRTLSVRLQRRAERTLPNAAVTIRRDVELGRGSFGVAYRATYGGQAVCVKIFHALENPDTFGIRTGTPEYERVIQDLLCEVDTMITLQHPHILAFRGLLLTPAGAPSAIVTELADCSLAGLLSSLSQPLSLPEVTGFFSDLTAGLAYLHTLEFPIVHRDIKPANVLVFRTGRGRPVLKIGDVGLARRVMDAQATLRRTVTVAAATPYYTAPEMRRWPPCYDMLADMYSLGVTMAEVVTYMMPPPRVAYLRPDDVPALGAASVRFLQSRGHRALAELLARCLEEASGNRLSATELLGRLSRL